MSLAERLALVQVKLDGVLMTDEAERPCFVQGGDNVMRRWKENTEIEDIVCYLEYKAQSLGV